MDDLISRQSAIEELERGVWGKEYDKALAKAMLESLPSVQQDRGLWFRIGEICVDESKGFISSGRAVEKIRELLREAEPYKGEES